MVKRIFRHLFLDKIAAVDRPCQEPAVMTIMKRALPGTDIRKGVVEAALQIRADLAKAGMIGGEPANAETFAETFAGQLAMQGLWDQFWKAQDALRQSICSIIEDDSVADKATMVSASLKEFADYVQTLVPGDIGKSMAAGFAAVIAGAAGPTLNNTGVIMSDALKKALGLTATATETDMLKALELVQKAGEGKVEKMSDKHSAFMNHKDAKLPKGGKDAFQEMSAADRDKHMSDNPIEVEDDDKVEKALKSGDAFKTPEGQVMHKRDFGTDAGYLFAKGANERLSTQAADIAKRDEADQVVSFAKRAVEIGQPETFGATLRKAYKGDATAQGEVEKTIGALVKQVATGALFDTFGSKTAKAGSAEAELLAKVDDVIKADPKLSREQAFTKVYTDRGNADLKKRYDAEKRAN